MTRRAGRCGEMRMKLQSMVILGLFLWSGLQPLNVQAESKSIIDKPRTYAEMTQELQRLVDAHPDLVRKFSIGKTYHGRQLWAIELTSGVQRLQRYRRKSIRPGILFLGNQHAREHLSAEIPLLFLQYLVNNYGVDTNITQLLDSRDIYFIPMANPDGVDYDLSVGAEGKYRDQVKNMRPNSASKPGVDLNANYSYGWGGPGSSEDPESDAYRGPSSFSEPETQAIRGFFEDHQNIKVLLHLTAFGEHILFPWFGTFSKVGKAKDYDAYLSVAHKISNWNKYSVQQGSELYIASGDVTDWAYDKYGAFSLTFRLSPQEGWAGGYYPSSAVIDKAFEDNLKPMLYLIEIAADPFKN